MKSKRAVALFLTLSFLPIFCIQNSNAAEEKNVVRTVISKSINETASYYLGGLGIDTGFEANENITRGEFTSLLMNLAYEDAYFVTDEEVFSDVPEEYEYAKDIYFAYSTGVVSKSEFFRPDDYIKTDEAFTMAINLLGYGFLAKQRGGYPHGYTVTASEIGLSKNVNSSLQTLNGENALILLYNILDVDFMTASIKNGEKTYSVEQNSTILTSRYGLKKMQGIVTATPYSDLGGEQSIGRKGFIKIDGKEFLYDGDAYDLLGMRVVAFIDEDDKAVIVCPYLNEIVEADNVYEFDGNKIKCESGSSIKQFSLDSSFCIIYNGRTYVASMSAIKAELEGISGWVKLADNDGDGDYDIISAVNIEYMTVMNIDKVNEKIYGETLIGNPSTIGASFVSYEDEETIINFYRKVENAHQKITISDISADDIIAVMISKDGKVGNVEVCTDEIFGKVTTISSEKVTIDGYEYSGSEYFYKKHSGITVGATGTFKLGLKGELLLFNPAAASEFRYGYLIDKGKNRRDDVFHIKILDEDGNIHKYSIAEKVMIDGIRIRTQKAWVTDMSPLTDSSNVTKRQLLRYKLDDGVVTAIDTATNAKKLDERIDDTNNALIKYYSLTNAVYKGQMKTFLKFNVSNNTKVFVVPDPTDTNVEDTYFGVENISYFGGKDTTIKSLDVFDFNSSGIPNMIVCYDSYSPTINNTSPFGVIEKVIRVWNEDEGMACYQISVWLDGAFTQYYVDPEIESQLFKSPGNMVALGDIVGFSQKNGLIKKLEIYYDAANNVNDFTSLGVSTYLQYDSGFDDQRTFVKASIYKKWGDNFVISWTKNAGGTGYDYALDNLRTVAIGNSTSIAVVDKSEKTIHSMYKDEILDYTSAMSNADEAVFVQGYWSCSNVIIYRR